MADESFDWRRLLPVPVAVPEALATRLERGLIDGSIPSGTKLPTERQLAQQLGVSRASVREAMHELTLKGWLTRKPGVGTVVQSRSGWTSDLLGRMDTTTRDLREVADFRQVFEPHIAELAALRATISDMHQLEEVCDANPETLTAIASVDLDGRFHRALAAATHNRLLVAVIEISAEWVHEFRLESQQTPAGRRASIEGHWEILEAIRGKDPAAAAAAMTRHIERFHEVTALRTRDTPAG
jgi:GntR family transcriptional regulator, transcriptional repressor for pyruvate dehydrogenase complex